jgi:hypothetical protein
LYRVIFEKLNKHAIDDSLDFVKRSGYIPNKKQQNHLNFLEKCNSLDVEKW